MRGKEGLLMNFSKFHKDRTTGTMFLQRCRKIYRTDLVDKQKNKSAILYLLLHSQLQRKKRFPNSKKNPTKIYDNLLKSTSLMVLYFGLSVQ